MMRNEFDRISSTKISTAELERAKRYLMGRHDIDLQRNASLSSSLMFDQLYGTNPTETFEFAKHIEPIGLDEVLKVSQRIFGQQHVLSIVS